MTGTVLPNAGPQPHPSSTNEPTLRVISAVTPLEFDYVRALVHDAAALVLEPGKDYLVESRLAPVARDAGFASIADMVARIRHEAYGRVHHEIVQAMTTNETSWFRDSHPFDALANEVLPQLIARRAAERRLTIWSAACSTGQEPYSIAMLLRDRFPELSSWDVTILASDLAEQAVAKGREGRYTQLEVNRGLAAEKLVRHFRRDGVDWVVGDHLRSMVRFGVVNLVGPWAEMPPPDVVMLRNVMIYFDHATKQRLLGRIRQRMRPDGYLFLGNAETTLNVDDGFVRIEPTRAGCYQLRSALQGQ
jgi:chemotaxis protein methyltransferase CheR